MGEMAGSLEVERDADGEFYFYFRISIYFVRAIRLTSCFVYCYRWRHSGEDDGDCAEARERRERRPWVDSGTDVDVRFVNQIQRQLRFIPRLKAHARLVRFFR